jgi:hypothetical protein
MEGVKEEDQCTATATATATTEMDNQRRKLTTGTRGLYTDRLRPR